ELVTRVVVHYEPDGEFRTAIPTVWQFHNGAFVEMIDPEIHAGVVTSTLPDSGQPLFDNVAVHMPDAVRGPARTQVRIQALAQRTEPKPEADRLPDGPLDGGSTLLLTPVEFPTASTTPSQVVPGATATLEASGLLPHRTAQVWLGGLLLATGIINDAGAVRMPLVMPNEARAGFRLITVGVQGAALTAEAVGEGGLSGPADIKPRSCRNPLPVHDRGTLPAAVLGTPIFDVTKVEHTSIQLNGVPPLRSALEDVATPYVPLLGKHRATDCTTAGPDG